MNFIKISTACPRTKVSDVDFNLLQIKACIDIALSENSKLVIFPELCITSYTCSDLFNQQHLIEKSILTINDLCSFSNNKDILIAVGAPLIYRNCLYNCAFIIYDGKILGIVPKSFIPNHSEFYEKRWFTNGKNIKNSFIDLLFQDSIPFGVDLIFKSGKFKFGFEICEDLWAVIPPSSHLALNGANILCNLSASNELVSKSSYRKSLIDFQSGKCIAAYAYASCGVHESTTDLVFSGHMVICENGTTLAENKRFSRENEILSAIIDVDKLNNERINNITFRDNITFHSQEFIEIPFSYSNTTIEKFDRYIDKHPFVPSNKLEREMRCKEIFNIQTAALAKRLSHTGIKKAVVGISGGLDSTLALLVAVKTFDMLNIPRKNIITITMPGFGTTDRTYNNAIDLCKNLKTDLREINIVDACIQHFKDIGHPIEKHDVTYENVQARERTQILMDVSNKEYGLLIGTGDLSELALGWCTYNGDHMSMYSVNCSIPKTLVRYLVKYVADKEVSNNVSKILLDVLDTPVSPELLPKDKSGEITQKTEDIVGPYELHDFFLYYFIRHSAKPEKILFLAKQAFMNDYDETAIEKWFDKFLNRFFQQQFKRSALPDGPKVGTISLSPRGDWRMPSDASPNTWKN